MLLYLQGPKLRIGTFPSGPVTLVEELMDTLNQQTKRNRTFLDDLARFLDTLQEPAEVEENDDEDASVKIYADLSITSRFDTHSAARF